MPILYPFQGSSHMHLHAQYAFVSKIPCISNDSCSVAGQFRQYVSSAEAMHLHEMAMLAVVGGKRSLVRVNPRDMLPPVEFRCKSKCGDINLTLFLPLCCRHHPAYVCGWFAKLLCSREDVEMPTIRMTERSAPRAS